MKPIPTPNLILSPRDLLQFIIRRAVEMSEADSGSLILLNPNTGMLDIEASAGLSRGALSKKLRAGEGITGWVAESGQPYRSGDVVRDKRYVPIDPRVRSEMAVPLLLRKRGETPNQVIGVINIDSRKANAFSARHQRALTDFARAATEWIVISWEIGRLRERDEQFSMLLDASRAIISQNCLDAVLRRVVRGAHRLMNARLCSLMLLSENEKELILKTWHGASADYTRKPNIPVDDSLVGAVIRRKKTLAVADVQEHSRYLHTELARREKLVSLLCAPLVFQGRIMGVLSVYTGQRHRFSNEEIRLLNAMAGMSAVAIAKAQMLDRIVAVEEDLKASERLCALGWLAAEMAHEIRNPLTVAQMLFHSLTQEVSFSGRALDDIRLIAEKMALMNRSLDRILGFARSAEPSRERLDAATLLEDIVLLTRHKLAEQKIELRTRVPKTPLPLLGDKAQLGQAILNLVLNAVQAMPKGGFLILSAKAQSLRGENLIAIGVRDTGTGISAKRRKTLFQPFLTDKKSGTGLGLALVKKTIESHGGSIRVRSSPGKGAAFTLLLPEARMDCL